VACGGADAGLRAVQRGECVLPEAGGVLLGLFQADPGDLPTLLLYPLAGHHQQGGFAEASGRGDDGAGTLDGFEAAGHHPRARHE